MYLALSLMRLVSAEIFGFHTHNDVPPTRMKTGAPALLAILLIRFAEKTFGLERLPGLISLICKASGQRYTCIVRKGGGLDAKTHIARIDVACCVTRRARRNFQIDNVCNKTKATGDYKRKSNTDGRKYIENHTAKCIRAMRGSGLGRMTRRMRKGQIHN